MVSICPIGIIYDMDVSPYGYCYYTMAVESNCVASYSLYLLYPRPTYVRAITQDAISAHELGRLASQFSRPTIRMTPFARIRVPCEHDAYGVV